jgi:ribosomal protein S7
VIGNKKKMFEIEATIYKNSVVRLCDDQQHCHSMIKIPDIRQQFCKKIINNLLKKSDKVNAYQVPKERLKSIQIYLLQKKIYN